MSDISEAQAAINGLAKAIGPKLFRSIPALAVAINKVASIEASAKKADALKAAAQREQKAAEDKLSVLQNTLANAEKDIKAAQARAGGIEAEAHKKAGDIIGAAQAEAVKSEEALKGKLDKLRAEIDAKVKEMNTVVISIGGLQKDKIKAEHDLREIREKAQAIGKG
jgi:chromosome segregation ATPase